eukprot:gene8781-9720_t
MVAKEVDAIFGTTYCIIFLITVTVNVLLLIILLKTKLLKKTPSKMLIYNVVIVDLISSLRCIPSSIRAFNVTDPAVMEIVCQLESVYITCVPQLTCVAFLLLAVNRFFAIDKPLLLKKVFSRRKTIVCIIINWLLVLLNILLTRNFDTKIHEILHMCVFRNVVTTQVSTLVIDITFVTVMILYIKAAVSYRARRRRTDVTAQTIRGGNETRKIARRNVPTKDPFGCDDLPAIIIGPSTTATPNNIRTSNIKYVAHGAGIHPPVIASNEPIVPVSGDRDDENNPAKTTIGRLPKRRCKPQMAHQRQGDVGITKTILIVTIYYFCSTFLLFACLLSSMFTFTTTFPQIYWKISLLLRQLSFSLTATVFFIVNKKFRVETKKLFTRKN